MSDVTPPPPTPEQPATPPAAAATPPAAPATPAYAPAPAAGPKQGLSLTSFIVGLAGLIFFWIPGLGFLAALAAVILGFIAKGKEPEAPKWMWLVGIISGFVGLFISLIYLVVVIVLPLIYVAQFGTLYY